MYTRGERIMWENMRWFWFEFFPFWFGPPMIGGLIIAFIVGYIVRKSNQKVSS